MLLSTFVDCVETGKRTVTDVFRLDVSLEPYFYSCLRNDSRLLLSRDPSRTIDHFARNITDEKPGCVSAELKFRHSSRGGVPMEIDLVNGMDRSRSILLLRSNGNLA